MIQRLGCAIVGLILDGTRIGGVRLAQLRHIHVVAAPGRVPNGVSETWTDILRWRRSAVRTIRQVRANVSDRWVRNSVVQKSDDHVVEEFGLLVILSLQRAQGS